MTIGTNVWEVMCGKAGKSRAAKAKACKASAGPGPPASKRPKRAPKPKPQPKPEPLPKPKPQPKRAAADSAARKADSMSNCQIQDSGFNNTIKFAARHWVKQPGA